MTAEETDMQYREVAPTKTPSKDGEYFLVYKDGDNMVKSSAKWIKEYGGWIHGAKDDIVFWLEPVKPKHPEITLTIGQVKDEVAGRYFKDFKWADILESYFEGQIGDKIFDSLIGEAMAIYANSSRQIVFPSEREMKGFIDKSEARRTFQGTPCFAQERLAFDSAVKETIMRLKSRIK